MSNWKLYSNVRYFGERTSLPNLLKEVRRFVKDKPVLIEDITFNSRYDNEQEDFVWSAMIIHDGDVTESN